MMVRRKISIPMKFVPISFVVLLGIIPLLFMQTIVNKTVQQIILENTTTLTRGILEQSRSYLNHLFEDMEISIGELIESDSFLLLLEDPEIGIEELLSLKKNTGMGNQIEELVILNINERTSLTDFPIDMNQFLNSEQAALLLENPSRTLWMGRPPVGSGDYAKSSMWLYQVIKSDRKRFVIAASINSQTLGGLLTQFASTSGAEVILISSDNQTIPANSDFFQYPFSSKALSRSIDSRFNIIYDSIDGQNGKKDLMVQTYTDPDYLYNLVIITPRQTLLSGFDSIVRITTLLLILLSSTMLLAGLFLAYLITKRLKGFIDAANKIGAGNYDLDWEPKQVQLREINILSLAMFNLAEEVKESRRFLEMRVKERSEELQRTRQSLIHSEKMAIMGRQGAKVAHEINNPLGVAVTASSHLGSVVSQIDKKFTSGNLTKSDFNSLLETSREVADIMERNLRQATSMIIGFKNFAADQAKEDREVISVDDYVGEIINSFSYEIKNTPFTIEYDGDNSLEIETIPSILYQTLTNLINNSLLHGFDGLFQGNIKIDIKRVTDEVVISYSDDGKGISPDNLTQLYKPFFTTKSGQGGTGLGLNIIKDLIEEGLKGTIDCKSTLGEGVLFTIRFPIDQEVSS